MSRAKCKSIKCKIRSEWQCINITAVLIGAVVSLMLALMSACLCGRFDLYGELCLPDCAPASFVFPIVWSLLYILIGAAAGAVVSNCDRCLCVHKNRGLLYFAVMFILSLLFSPVFFGAGLFFCGFVILAGVTVLCFFVIICFCRIYFICGAAMFVFWLWLVFMLYINLAVLFLN